MPETDTMTKLVRPFWGRVSVIESPVDEEERPSGLVVPLRHEGMTVDTTRGIVAHVDQSYQDIDGWGAYTRRIDTGTVVYFRRGIKVRDLWIVDIGDILAYEADE